MPRPTRFTIVLSLVGALLLALPVAAQDDRFDAPPAAPGFVQRGTCDAPGAAIAALAAPGSDDTIEPTQVAASPPPGVLPVAASVTVLDLRLDQLTAVEHVVRIVPDADAPDETVACGRIGGRPDADGNLYVGLAERDDSGVWGVAWLQGDGGTTTVTIFLLQIPEADDGEPAA